MYTQGWTDGSLLPRTCKLRPSNRIDVKDLRRVVLPWVFDFGLSLGFLSISFARARERESSSTSRRSVQLSRNTPRWSDENFLKNRLAAYPSDIGRYTDPSPPPPSISTIPKPLCSPTPSVLSPPDLNQIAGMIYGDIKQTRPIPSFSFSSSIHRF